MKVCFITFGCRLSRAEALDEEARYLAAGWETTDDHAEADRFVVRGCSVTSRAEHDCEKLIRHLQKAYPGTPLVVQGCIRRTTQAPVDASLPAPEAAPVPTRTARAFLKIQDGCSGKCSFCIVPRFRGTSVSVAFDAALERARRFIEAGYGEIVLTGCNLVLYASQGKRLPELVAALAELGAQGPRPCRIRLGSVEPGACAEEVVHVMAEHPNVCKYLHLPVQSGSDRLLIAMRRPYLTKQVASVVNLAARLMPLVGLGCDMISGFPGETDLDHEASIALLSRLPFNHVHAFPYSERPGTVAPLLGDRVHHEVRSLRAHEIARLVDAKRALFAQKFIGRRVEVIIEDEEKQEGWTSEYLPFALAPGHANTRLTPRKQMASFTVATYRHGLLCGR